MNGYIVPMSRRSLANGYSAVYEKQQMEGMRKYVLAWNPVKVQQDIHAGKISRLEFWGLRDFYATVKSISRGLRAREVSGRQFDGEMLYQAVAHNFGGYPFKMNDIAVTFFQKAGIDLPESRPYTVELIKQTLEDKDARHLLILTKSSAAVGLPSHVLALRYFGDSHTMSSFLVLVSLRLDQVFTPDL